MSAKLRSVCVATISFGAALTECLGGAADELRKHSEGPYRVLQSLAERRAICGINCLYVLARMERDDVTFEDVERTLVVHPQGNSLLELQTAAKRLGLQVEMGWRDPADWRWRLPAIVHARFGEEGDAVRNEHYFVILKTTADGVVCIDGTDGTIRRVGRRRMEELMTGYVLESVRRDGVVRGFMKTRTNFLVFGFAIAGLLTIFACRGWSIHNRRTSEEIPKDGNPDRDGRSATTDLHSGVWRSPNRDAINSLYLLVALAHGDRKIHYDRIVSEFRIEKRPHSLASLSAVASRLGYDVEVVRIREWEKAVSILPAVMHLQDPRSSGGSLVYVYQMSDDVLYINGGLATVGSMSIDEFRRKWSGHACIASTRAATPVNINAAIVVFQWIAIVVIVYSATRVASRVLLRRKYGNSWSDGPISDREHPK